MGRSDLVRRAMAKKKAAVMNQERAYFVNGLVEDGQIVVPGAVRNGIDAKLADQIFDQMIDFASYAFNKSHAAAYGVVRLPDRLPEIPLPGGVHGRDHELDDGRLGQDRRLHPVLQEARHRRAAAGHQPQPGALHRRGSDHPLWHGRGEKRGRAGGGRPSSGPGDQPFTDFF